MCTFDITNANAFAGTTGPFDPPSATVVASGSFTSFDNVVQVTNKQPRTAGFTIDGPRIAGKSFPVANTLIPAAGSATVKYVEDNMSFDGVSGSVTIDSVNGANIAMTLRANMIGELLPGGGRLAGTFLLSGHCTGTL
jgi:hypothetical protein